MNLDKTTEQAELLQQIIETRINIILRKGSLASAMLGLGSALLLSFMSFAGWLQFSEIPIIWTIFGGLYSLSVFLLARSGKITGFLIYVVMLGFVSIPTTVYLAASAFLPAGMATFLNGPPGYLYFFLIIVTGLAFDFRLSLTAGIGAALQYQLIIHGSVDQLSQLQHPDQALLYHFSEPVFLHFRTIMMAVSGLVVGILGRQVREMITEITEKEAERMQLNRLFGEYVSPEVREQIIRSATGTHGERKSAALLFCDIRNFTSWAEKMDPAALVDELNEYLSIMEQAITGNSGTIDKFIGDAILAVFGGVLQVKNPADSAILAAFAMREALQRLNFEREQRGLERLQCGIGVHYGEIFLGSIGSKNRKDFTVMGDAVNAASRVESLCKTMNSDLLITEEVFSRLSSELRQHARFLDDIHVKGKAQALNIYGFC